MVSNTIDDFPDPETPVKIEIACLGIVRSTPRRLFSRAPRISMERLAGPAGAGDFRAEVMAPCHIGPARSISPGAGDFPAEASTGALSWPRAGSLVVAHVGGRVRVGSTRRHARPGRPGPEPHQPRRATRWRGGPRGVLRRHRRGDPSR